MVFCIGDMALMTNHLPGFTRYLQVLEGLSEITVITYTKKIAEFFTYLAEKNKNNETPQAVTYISRQDLERYLEWCYYKGNGNQTRYTKLIALSKFFRYLKYEDIIPEDITLSIPRPVIRNKRMQSFSKEDILNMFRAIDVMTGKGLRDIAIVILGVFCGLRIGEICKLKLEHILDDGKDMDIDIPADIAKKKHGRTLYLWKPPAMFIRQYVLVRLNQGARADSPFLITYKNQRPAPRPMSACDVDDLLKRYAAKAGIRKTKISSHMLRATHANDLQHIKGYTLSAIQERMGWQDLSTAGRYLIRRERIHKTYESLYHYWRDFMKIWSIPQNEKKGGNDADSNNEQPKTNNQTTPEPVATAGDPGGKGGHAVDKPSD